MIISYTCAGPALTCQNPWHEKGPLLFVSCDAEKKVEVSTLIVRIYDLLQILTTNISGLKQNNKKKEKDLKYKSKQQTPSKCGDSVHRVLVLCPEIHLLCRASESTQPCLKNKIWH